MFTAFRRKMRANETATTHPMPKALIAAEAVSREDPQPKFLPATIRSPGLAFFVKSGSSPSMIEA